MPSTSDSLPADGDHRGTEEGVPADSLAAVVAETARRAGSAAAAAVIAEHWDRYAHTDPAALLAALRALPGEAFVDNVALVSAANYLKHVVSGGGPDRFEQHPAATTVPGRRSGDLVEYLIGLTGTSATARTKGQHAAAVEAATEARRALTAAEPGEVGHRLANLPHLFVQWGRALELSGDHTLPVAYEYEEAHRVAVMTEQPQVARRAAGHLAWHLAARGRLSAALDWAHRARNTGESNPRYDAAHHLAAALVHADRLQEDASAHELALVAAHPVGEYWAAASWVRSFLAHTKAEQVLLEEDLARELGRHPPAVSNRGMNGQYVRATWMRLGRSVAGHRPVTPDDHLLRAIGEYRRGRFIEAIDDAAQAAEPLSPPRVRAGAFLITAASSLALQRSRSAAHNFRLAHSIIEQEDMRASYHLISDAHLQTLAPGAHSLLAPRRREAATEVGSLTKRERDVLQQLTTTRSMSEIATELFISPNTLKATASRLYRKLGVNSRAAAADIAQRAGISVQPPSGRGDSA